MIFEITKYWLEYPLRNCNSQLNLFSFPFPWNINFFLQTARITHYYLTRGSTCLYLDQTFNFDEKGTGGVKDKEYRVTKIKSELSKMRIWASHTCNLVKISPVQAHPNIHQQRTRIRLRILNIPTDFYYEFSRLLV